MTLVSRGKKSSNTAPNNFESPEKNQSDHELGMSGRHLTEDDGKGTSKGGRWQKLSQPVFRLKERMKRWLVVVLLGLNLLVFLLPTSETNEGGSLPSFRRWKESNRLRLPATYQPPTLSSHPTRKKRFPSVQERVRFYMGRWYEPKLEGVPPSPPFQPHWEERWKAFETGQSKSPWYPVRVEHEPLVNPLDMDPEKLYQCSLRRLSTNDYAIATACLDTNVRRFPSMVRRSTYDTVSAALLTREYQGMTFWSRFWNIWKHEGLSGYLTEWQWQWQWQSLSHQQGTSPAFLWHYGKGVTEATPLWNTGTPVFGRVRDILAGNDAEPNRFQRLPRHSDCSICGPRHSPILWPLERVIHHAPAAKVPLHDLPFESKKRKLIWRGSGYPVVDMPLLGKLPINLSGYQQRLALVEHHHDSGLVDAKFLPPNENQPNEFLAPELTSHKLSLSEMLGYRYMLAVEGVDVDDDLLWKLFSNSVVFMPNVTYASWSMENFLKPWVHFIPIAPNMMDLEDMIRWADDHPDEAKEIAERSTLFVYDLLFHPDAYKDEDEIMRSIIHRYHQFVLRGKPIGLLGKMGEKMLSNLNAWYEWFTEDYLRIALVAIFLAYGCL